MSVAIMSTRECSDGVYGANERRFGEVIITSHREIVLRCTRCEKEHRIYKTFLEHIVAHYNSEVKRLKIANDAQCVAGQAIKKEIPGELRENEDVPVKEELLIEADKERDPLSEKGLLEADPSQSLRTPSSISPENKEGGRNNNTQAVSAVNKTDSTLDKFLEEEDLASSDSSQPPTPLPKLKRRNVRKHQPPAGERPFKCKICGQAFRDVSNCRAHERRHTGEKSHSCQYCNKKFFTSTECNTHERVHTGERPYVCAACGKNFGSRNTLTRHELRHQNYRHVKCNICDKRFFDTKVLKAHLVVHTRERKHICDVCNAAFLHLRNLRTHSKLHANEREYKCNLCEMAFNQFPALWLHKKNKHKIITHRATNKMT